MRAAASPSPRTHSNPTLTIPLSGTGLAPGALGSNPTSLSFGSVTVGSNQSASETVTNTGGSSVTISQVGISGTGFSLSGITAPVTLTAGQSATFSVTFTPQSAASASGSVTVTSNAPNPTLTIPLSGTGLAPGALGSNPTSLSFGSVTVGSNQSVSETVTNTGGSSVTISQVGISGTGFSLSGITAPVTLTAGQSATFSVTFTPTIRRNCERQRHRHFECNQSDLDHSFVGHGARAGGTGIESDQSQLRQRHRGQQSVCVRDGDQYRRIQRHHFSGRDQRDWIQPEWDHCSCNADGRPECDVQCHVHATIRRNCERQRHRHFECNQSDLDHSFVGHGARARGTGIESDQSQFRQRHRRQQSVRVRVGDQHRRIQRHHFSGRDQRDWIQP